MITCQYDNTALNHILITEYWLSKDSSLSKEDIGNYIIFCCNKPQHMWIKKKGV